MYWPEETDGCDTEDARFATWDRLRVLVVENSRLVAEALMFTLHSDPTVEAIGYGLDGWEALEHTATHDPDVILVGPRLTGIDRFEFSRLVHELFPHVLVIMLCERLIPAEVESAYAIGVADCVPITRSADELLRAISAAQRRRQAFDRGQRRAAPRPRLTLVQRGEADDRP